MKIKKLTPAQETELPAFRQRYLDIACGGGRIDRAALESALADAYAVIDKPAPRLFIFDSPAACMLALKIFKLPKEDQLGGQLRDQLWGQLADQLWDQLWDQLGGQLADQLRDQLWGQLADQLRDQLGGQLWDQLGGQLWGQLADQLRDQLWGQNIYDNNYLWGSQDLYWIAWVRFAEYVGAKLKPDTAKRLDIMERISTQCEWWWPYDGIVVASERPVAARFDERRLHGENRAAVEYADGYAVWSWRGVNVPKEWITDKAITAAQALQWPNMEQRRAACEILGWATILEQLDATTVEKDEDPLIGELVQVTIPDVGREKFLRVRCGTGRDFALPVPPDTTTALHAQAWLNWSTPDEIRAMGFRT